MNLNPVLSQTHHCLGYNQHALLTLFLEFKFLHIQIYALVPSFHLSCLQGKILMKIILFFFREIILVSLDIIDHKIVTKQRCLV